MGLKSDDRYNLIETLDEKVKEVILFESFSLGGVLGFEERGAQGYFIGVGIVGADNKETDGDGAKEAAYIR